MGRFPRKYNKKIASTGFPSYHTYNTSSANQNLQTFPLANKFLVQPFPENEPPRLLSP